MVQSQQKVGDQTITEKPPVASFWNVYLLGIAMKLGGCTIAWNYGKILQTNKRFPCLLRLLF